jgi:O-antigen ligase
MNNENDVTSGRDVIFKLTTLAISQNPLLGYGIDQFENNTGIVYPHNFILQLLYDGGLVLTFLVIFPVIRGIVKLFKTCSYNEFIVFVALFFASVPGGLLSGDLWTMVTLWVFFGAVFSKQFVYHRNS